MLHTLIGLIVGIIMGLTGAGGALVSIPLFIALLNASLKEATVLSLVAVALGTATNLFGQKYKWDKKIVLNFVIFGALANYASLPLKAVVPDITIALLLTGVATFSLWNIWKKNSYESEGQSSHSIFKMAGFGIIIGLVTTFTGLGGGVLLVPILMKYFRKSYEESLPTSLATILFISTISFLLQIQSARSLITYKELTFLAAGAVCAFLLLKLSMKFIEPKNRELLRKVVFTAVTLYSIGSVLLKTLS